MRNVDNITGSEKILDGRDITARMDELRSMRDEAVEGLADAEEAYKYDNSDDTKEGQEWDDLEDDLEAARTAHDAWLASDECTELEYLEAADIYDIDEAFIADSHFEEYAQQLAEDIGAIPSNAYWPCTCIDWERAAKELQQDYSCVEINGNEFWYRA